MNPLMLALLKEKLRLQKEAASERRNKKMEEKAIEQKTKVRERAKKLRLFKSKDKEIAKARDAQEIENNIENNSTQINIPELENIVNVHKLNSNEHFSSEML